MGGLLLKGASIHTAEGCQTGDILVAEGVITAIGEGLVADSSTRVVDCHGKHIVYGLVDVHVHLREPGFSHKETIRTGTLASAHGGYTTVCSMPNLNPAPDTAEHLQQQLDIIERDAVIEVLPYASITLGQRGKGELVDFETLATKVAGFSDDGRGVQSEALMAEAMRKAKAAGSRIVAHCEVDDLLHGGYIHDGEYCRENNHRGICSESEWEQVERDIRLAEATGCQYHVCHISTRESVDLVRRAKARGLKVSCETGPHYLLLCDMDLQEEGRFKMNPPLRSAEDRDALIEGILDGTIEVLATDHAPHAENEKAKGLAGSAFGIVGIETAFPLMYTHFVKSGKMTFEHLLDIMSKNPRKIFGLGGSLAVGERADLAIFDLDREYEIRSEEFLSMGHSTPFEGWKVYGECVMTLCRGEIAYKKGDQTIG
ncbi:MAG: dihydroorotase [Alistipes sp.]|nr:dihydroorotase [Alistipes sp.]